MLTPHVHDDEENTTSLHSKHSLAEFAAILDNGKRIKTDELLDRCVAPMLDIIKSAKEAMVASGVPQMTKQNAECPFYYLANPLTSSQTIPWNYAEEQAM